MGHNYNNILLNSFIHAQNRSKIIKSVFKMIKIKLIDYKMIE